MTYTSHNKICYACGQEKKRREMGYDIRTLKTYCKKDCPESELIPDVELVELRTEDLRDALESHYNEELLQIFNRVLGKTVSTRPVPAMAMHLMKTAKVNDLNSISETLTFILERDFEQYEVKENIFEEGEEAQPIPKEVDKPWARLEPKQLSEIELERVHDHLSNPKPLPNYYEQKTVETMKEIKININEKPIEPKQEEEEDDEWEI